MTLKGGLKREEWMVELPQKLKVSYGLTAKTAFAKSSDNPSTTNSNLWTDTPNEKFKSSKVKILFLLIITKKKFKLRWDLFKKSTQTETLIFPKK